MTFSLVGICPGSDATLSFAAHYEMLKIIKHFACGQLNLDSYSGTGNGDMKRMSVMADNAPEEVWTVTATSATNFTVSGSISGAQAAATVDTFYDNGLVSFIIIAGGTAFVSSDAFVLSSTNGVRTLYQSTYAGAGNGKLTNMRLLDKVAEVWTLTCTVASLDAGTFSVSGSISGAQANATVDVFYDNSIIQFLINDSTADFEVGDVFTLTANTQELPLADRYEVLRFDDTSDDYELIIKGNGIVGVGPNYIGLKTIQSQGGDYYNLSFATMEGYVDGNSYAAQPKLDQKTMPLWQFDVRYWLRVTARQVTLGTDVETLNDIGGAGLYSGYYDPGIYPYPAFVMGSLDGLSSTRYDNTTRKFGIDSGVSVLWLDGTYKTPKTLPFYTIINYWNPVAFVMVPTDTARNTFVGTGDGTLEAVGRAVATAPLETWVITATSATNFTVVGSISGAQTDATVGVAYTNSLVRFVIYAGATAFVSSDEFTLILSREYPLNRVVLNDTTINYGEIEGVHQIAGFANAAENTILDDNGDTHIVLRSINRTGFMDYCTLELD